jgi:hypothetical protein
MLSPFRSDVGVFEQRFFSHRDRRYVRLFWTLRRGRIAMRKGGAWQTFIEKPAG